MRLDVYHHIVLDSGVRSGIDALSHKTDLINHGVNRIMKTLDELLAQGQTVLEKVQRNDDLDDSFLQLHAADVQTIRDLRAQLAEAGNDPAKLQALGDLMDQFAAKQDAEAQKKLDAMKAGTDAATA